MRKNRRRIQAANLCLFEGFTSAGLGFLRTPSLEMIGADAGTGGRLEEGRFLEIQEVIKGKKEAKQKHIISVFE